MLLIIFFCSDELIKSVNISECSFPDTITVLGPLLFLIIDIDKGISPSSKLVSFADDSRVYSCINAIEKGDQLQIDLNSVYNWDHVNNMFFNAQKFNNVSFNGSVTPCTSNIYILILTWK